MANRVQHWAKNRCFGLFAANGYRSQTVTTIENTHDLDIAALNAEIGLREMRIANGYGSLKNKTFRIAHMGELVMKEIDELLSAMDKFMA